MNVASKRKRKRSRRCLVLRVFRHRNSRLAPKRDRVEGVEVEHTSVGSDIAVSGAIRSLKCATIAKAEIPRIVTGTADRHEIRTGFRETHSANGIHQARDLLCDAGGKGICDLPRREDRKEARVASNYGGCQPYSNIPAIGGKIKTVGNRCTVDNFQLTRGKYKLRVRKCE